MNKLFCLLFFISFLIFTFSCKKKEDERVLKFPNVTLTKLGTNDTVIEGGSDTLKFEVRLDDFLDYEYIELYIDYGGSDAIREYRPIIEDENFEDDQYSMAVGEQIRRYYYKIRLSRGQNSRVLKFKKPENKYYEKGNDIKFRLNDGIFGSNGTGKVKDFGSENISLTYQLVDNDFPPIAGLKEGTEMPESWNKNSYVTVYLDAPSAVQTTIYFDLSGTAEAGDYVIKTARPIIIPPFKTEATIHFNAIDDKVYESNPQREYFEIRLSNPINAVIANLGNSSTLKESAKVEIDDREDQ